MRHLWHGGGGADVSPLAEVMLERLGKVSGWAGTGFALLAFTFAFAKWSPGHGEALYFGVLVGVVLFLMGQAVRYVLVARSFL